MKPSGEGYFYLALGAAIAGVIGFMLWIAWGLANLNDALSQLS